MAITSETKIDRPRLIAEICFELIQRELPPVIPRLRKATDHELEALLKNMREHKELDIRTIGSLEEELEGYLRRSLEDHFRSF